LPVELVIFDCDGVLVDSERLSVRVGTAALRELGWSIDEAEYAARFVGCSDEEWDRAVGDVPAAPRTWNGGSPRPICSCSRRVRSGCRRSGAWWWRTALTG
jgi:beta-phosphoglucomutase-like phosphatase (HAD superfamily)